MGEFLSAAVTKVNEYISMGNNPTVFTFASFLKPSYSGRLSHCDMLASPFVILEVSILSLLFYF